MPFFFVKKCILQLQTSLRDIFAIFHNIESNNVQLTAEIICADDGILHRQSVEHSQHRIHLESSKPGVNRPG